MIKGIIKVQAPEKANYQDVYELIKEKNVVCCVNNTIYIQNDNELWIKVSDNKAVLMIRSMFADSNWQPFLGTDKILTLIRNLKTDPSLQKPESDFIHPDLIRFKNGIWNISCDSFQYLNSKPLFRRSVDVCVPFEAEDESPEFVNFCERVFDQKNYTQKKQVLYEIIGYAISDIENVKKAIFLIGPSNTGKSVILRFIQRLVGEENVSNISLDNFAHRFSVAEMAGKCLNISGEVPSGMLTGKALDIFKNLTGGDKIEIEKKGCQPSSAKITTKLLFAGNTLPVFSNVDGTDSLVERLHIILFDKQVEESERDKDLENKLWEQRDLIVRYALTAVHRFVSKNKEFIVLDDEKQLLQSIAKTANPVSYFLESCMEYGEEYYIHISDAYEAFRKFAAEEALPDVPRTIFRNMVAMHANVCVCKTKKRLGKGSPKSCFQGIKLKNYLYDKKQDTEMYDTEEEI